MTSCLVLVEVSEILKKSWTSGQVLPNNNYICDL